MVKSTLCHMVLDSIGNPVVTVRPKLSYPLSRRHTRSDVFQIALDHPPLVSVKHRKAPKG
jgi:hypothetical protein